MSNYHVSRNKDEGGWKVQREGAERVSSFAQTQGAAEKVAKQFAESSGGGEVRIHGRDGKIRDSDTVAPAKDPFPPRDRKH
jgi:hypothetical protein